MAFQAVKFNMKDRPEFIKTLRGRVNQYFKDNNIHRYSNANMVIKTIFMILLYTIPLVVMLTGLVSSFWGVMALWVIMGFGMAGIGLSVMHDANHGSYSKHKKVNHIIGYISNFLGAYHINWRIQHNVLHHSFTNIEGHDEDIDIPVMRFSPTKEKNKWFRYQAYYATLFYGIMTLYWTFGKDFFQLIRYKRKKLLKPQGVNFKRAMAELTFNKIWYLAIFLGLPILFVNLPWWQTVLGFVGMNFICGVFLAYIFQPAHVLEDTDFFVPDENSSVENHWAIHQLKTTANFSKGSKWFTWFIGGLNYQIEHHLFPNICHVHYPKIAHLVRQTAQEFNVPYYEHKTFYRALKSHFSLLNDLGKGVI